MISNPLLISTFLAILTTVRCTNITIYEDAGRTSVPIFLWWGGGISQQYTLEQDTCITLDYFDKKVSSIDPHDEGCVKIWEQKNCSGSSMVVTDRSGCSKNLAACDISTGRNWDNVVSSMSSCSDAEESQASHLVDNEDLVESNTLLLNSNNARTTGGELQRDVRPIKSTSGTTTVKLCKHTDCKRQESIEAKASQGSCINFGGDWDRQVNAFTIYWIYCVTIFAERDCKGKRRDFCAINLWDSEARDCVKDLSTCGWSNRIRSMGLCKWRGETCL